MVSAGDENDATGMSSKPTTATSRGTWAPNVQLEWTAAPGCTGTPAHATAVANNTSICPGQAVNGVVPASTVKGGIGAVQPLFT